jgi:hypothetical protein
MSVLNAYMPLDLVGPKIMTVYVAASILMQKTARPPWFECATDNLMVLATDGLPLWDGMADIQVRPGSLRRRQDGVHRAPRRSATAISKGKTTPGSLSSLHSPISMPRLGGAPPGSPYDTLAPARAALM